VAFVVAFLVGAIPFSQVAARLKAGTDLRQVGTGTVSGTGLYRVAGFWPLAIAGVFEVLKGAVGPLLAGPGTVSGAVAGGLAVAGHNWSPFLKGAGGRGISPAVGAMLVIAWPGAVLLLGGMALGGLVNQAGAGSFVAYVLLTPVLGSLYGVVGTAAAIAVLVPMLVKRVLGNERPHQWTARTIMSRLVLDTDDPSAEVEPSP
jgi:acyl phosphate:glycerol-3-phosphate acyltransferase